MPRNRRAPEEERRRELIDATLECIAELGIQATSLRTVAARAGVTNGLIRHHFENKANLIVAAYQRATALISGPGLAVLEKAEGTPAERLSLLVKTLLGAEETDYRHLALWATFISQSPVDPMIAAVREESYDSLRQATERLIGELLTAEGRACSAGDLEQATLETHAVLDGFWIAACLEPDRQKAKSLPSIALGAIGKVLGVPLA